MNAATRARRVLSSALPVAFAAGGCSFDGPMSTLPGRSDYARSILHLYTIITWSAVVIALIVFGAELYILLGRRARRTAGGLPPQTRGHTLLEISWTIAPALVLLIIAVPTIQVIFRTQAVSKPPDALEIVVRGYQWWWEYRYPALGVITANEVHLPAGRPVVFVLEGPDVIHSFWIPRLGGKRDVVPGRVNHIVVTADAPGEFWGQCAEFCGASHANMGMRVWVHTPAEFDAWVAAQRAPAVEPTGAAAAGKTIFAASACVGCHTIRGVSAGMLGPDLTHFGSRTTVAAGMWPNTPENVAAWVKNPIALKPGVKMPNLGLTDEQAGAIAAYLTALK